MKPRFLLLLPLLLGACSSNSSSSKESNVPEILAGNMQGVAVKYDGSAGGLHEAQLEARHNCERWSRNPALLNEAPMQNGGSLAYFVCQ